MLKKILLTIVTVSASTAAIAGPNCTQYPENERMSATKLQADMEKQGYQIRKFDTENNCYELKGKNPQGERVEMYFDMKTGEIVHTKK